MGQNALYWRTSESESSSQWLQLDSSSGGGGGAASVQHAPAGAMLLLEITALHEPRFGLNT
jgi:hypothetical protein